MCIGRELLVEMEAMQPDHAARRAVAHNGYELAHDGGVAWGDVGCGTRAASSLDRGEA